ncbi:MAG TPA: histidinol-phosphate transaminase [Gemmatimonadaceae bacterium]|nr:histidinol-phosphate transaminase [Gemmatimonadaceae bacterium]
MSALPSDQLARADLASIPRLAPGPDVEINLGENTNLWGSPPAAIAALREAAVAVTHYPDMYAGSLKRTVAELAGVATECVVTGNGSDDVIDCAIRAFASPGERIAHPEPTFVMVPIFSRLNSVVPVPVPLRPNFEMDCDALLATGARIIYLCSPNNPVPVSTRLEEIRRVIANAPGLVILDEAYVDFTGEPGLLREAPALGRVLVCRTLSKAHGLAGLRAGYATAAASIVEAVEKSRGPFKVNTMAERASVAALTEGREWVRAHVAEAISSRDRLAGALRTLGLPPLPSHANFLLVPTSRAFALATHLRERGIAVRPFRNLPGIGDAFRITAGPWPLMERVLAALREAA